MRGQARHLLFLGERVLTFDSAEAMLDLERQWMKLEPNWIEPARLYVQAIAGYHRDRADPTRAIAWRSIARQIEILLRYELSNSAAAPPKGHLAARRSGIAGGVSVLPTERARGPESHSSAPPPARDPIRGGDLT